MNVSPEELLSANWWYAVSWWGVLVSAVATALGGVGALVFVSVQFRTGNIRDAADVQQRAALVARTAAAETETERAHSHIRTLDQAIVTAAERAAEADTTIKQERGARLELEHQTSPRRLSSAQQLAIIASLQGKTCEFYVQHAGDGEATSFATQVIEAFRKAGCRVHASGAIFLTPRFGVEISPRATVVADAMQAAGLSVKSTDHKPAHPSSVGRRMFPVGATVMWIGMRPAN